MRKIWMALMLVALIVPSVGQAQPTLKGPTSATVGEEYCLQGSFLYALGPPQPPFYYIDWGDGTNSGWNPVGPSECFPHVWTTQGIYTLRAKDRSRHSFLPIIFISESDWSDPLVVTVQPSSGIIGALENPTLATVSGVNPIYGWAIHPQGIAKIELYIDDQLIGNIAYGGSRPDVKASYPDYPNAENSGFAAVYNFSTLSSGTHIIKVRPYNQDGQFKDLSVSVNVIKFHGDSVESMSPDQRWLRINRVRADGITKTYNILIEWDYESQGFRINDIQRIGR